jgi:hypothetical protein
LRLTFMPAAVRSTDRGLASPTPRDRWQAQNLIVPGSLDWQWKEHALSALDLQYDAETDRLRASWQSAAAGDTVRVRQGKVVLYIDRVQKQVVSFEVVDFRHFVSYHLLDELFGDEAVREIAAFQSAVVATSQRRQLIQVPAPPRSSRRVVEELLRAA